MKALQAAYGYIAPALLALWLLLAPLSVSGFSLKIPDDMKDQPEEVVNKWIEGQMKEAHKEQLEVGKKRYESRIEQKKMVARRLVADATQRRENIARAREERQRVEEESDTMFKGMYFLTGLFVISLVSLYYYFFHRTRMVKVPETGTREQRQALETSEMIMKRLKRKKKPAKKQ